MARSLQLLLYDYVPDIVERRRPHREAHLALVRRWHGEGRLVMAGALGDPPRGAAFAFSVPGAEEIAAFCAEDPYVTNGLVTERRVEPWSVVVA